MNTRCYRSSLALLGIIFVLVAALLVTGCYESPLPIDATPQIETDARLMGTWRCVSPDEGDDDEVLKLTVVGAGPRTYSIIATSADDPPERYDAYSSVIGGVTFLNLRPVGEMRWSFFTYSLLQPDLARVRVLSDRLLRGVPEASPRKVIEEKKDTPGLFEEFAVCVRVAKPDR